MGWTIFTNTNRVVGEVIGHSVKFRKGGNTDSGTQVVNEDQESGSRDLEESVVCESVHDGSHGVFADTKVQVLSGVRLVESSTEVSSVVDVVTGGSVKIGRSGDVVGNKTGDFLDGLVSRDTGGFGASTSLGDVLDHFRSGHDIVVDGVVELLGEFGVGFLPGSKGLLPFVVSGGILLLDLREHAAGSFRDVPLFSFGEANVELGLVNVRDTGFTVSSVGTFGFFHTLTNDGVGLDELGLAVVGSLGGGDGFFDRLQVMSIDFVSFPSVSFVTLDDVLGLSVFGHLVKGDFVGVINDDQVVELFVSGKAGSFGRNTFLEATITGKSKDVVVEDLVIFRVVNGSGHLLGSSETDGVRDTLSKRARGGFDSGRVVLGGREFGVTGGHGVVLTEVLDLIHGKIISGKVEPGVKEHGTVSSRKDETIAVDPLGVLGIVLHLGAPQDGANLGATKGKTHVTRVSGGDRVHGQTTSLVGGGSESSHLVSLDGSAHLQGRRLKAESLDLSRGKSMSAASIASGDDSETRELHGFNKRSQWIL
mmetsp:Transcript_10547/g.20282  ORF Transcript_10547/g.20282 Transcript_10547/m.20282 type:complete len:535 (-) Transcript_10547:50-1654(-)